MTTTGSCPAGYIWNGLACVTSAQTMVSPFLPLNAVTTTTYPNQIIQPSLPSVTPSPTPIYPTLPPININTNYPSLPSFYPSNYPIC